MTSHQDAPDMIILNGRFTTLDKSKPTATAVAIKDGIFIAVGDDSEISQLKSDSTRRVDLKGRSALPGLIDNHLHIIRGGLNFNMELRWDGVRSLATAMEMLKAQVAITPPPQWVRVVGGFTEHQFDERRLPTIEELNAAAPDTPVFMLHLYDRAWRRDCARWRGQSDRLAPGEAQRGHPLCDVSEGPQASARISTELDAAFHARAEQAGRHRGH
jgi:predicted amidohydrolase YtcJ